MTNDIDNFPELFVKGSSPTYEGGDFDELFINGIDREYGAQFALFRNLSFRGSVRFESTTLGKGFQFHHCVVSGLFALNKVKTRGSHTEPFGNSWDFYFHDCTFKDIVVIDCERIAIEGGICFDNCRFENGIEIKFLHLNFDGITFDNCTIKQRFHISNVLISSSFTIKNCKIECFATLHNIWADSISIVQDNVFFDNFYIKESNFKNGVTFNYGTFKKDFWIRLVKTESSGLSIFGSKFEGSLEVDIHWDNAKPIKGISQFYIKTVTFQSGFYVNGVKDMFADAPLVDQIELVVSRDLSGEIIFNNIHVGILLIEGYNSSV